jgi:hypothetical protein
MISAGTILLFGFVIAVGALAYRLILHGTYASERIGRVATPARTMAAYRTQQDIAHTDLQVLPDWTDCPCCGYPTLDRGSESYHVCEICDWEDTTEPDEEALREAKKNFKAYGTCDTPAEWAQWGLSDPDPEVIRAKKAVMAACDEVRGGHMDLATWWRTVQRPLGLLSARRT